MKSFSFIAALVIGSWLCLAPVFADQNNEQAKGNTVLENLEKVRTQIESENAKGSTDEEFAKNYTKAKLEWATYTIENAKRVFTMHYWTSILVFVVVISIVIFSLFLSWLQFVKDLKTGPTKIEMNEIAINKEGIKLKSSVIGVIILVISLGFFYLYLKYVYPVTFL